MVMCARLKRSVSNMPYPVLKSVSMNVLPLLGGTSWVVTSRPIPLRSSRFPTS